MEFAHVSVSVRSLESAMTFYSSVFGLDEVRSRLDLPEQDIRSAIVGSHSSLTVEFFERALRAGEHVCFIGGRHSPKRSQG